MNKGVFITFEGGDGSGKSTQIARLAHFLEENGHRVYITREPGGSEKTEHIRRLLLLKDGPAWDPLTEYLLFSAARRQHIIDVIIPHLRAGNSVLCDRFIHSSLAYQGYGHGVALSVIQDIYDTISDGLWPDLTFFLKVDSMVGLNRTQKRWDRQKQENGKDEKIPLSPDESRFEDMDLSFHARVHEGFQTLAAADPRIYTIDGSESVDNVTKLIEQKIRSFLAIKGE